MKNLLTLTESEKSRILNLHKSAIKKEFLFEQRMDAEGKNVEMYTQPTNTATAPTTPTTSNTGNNTPVKYPWIGADGKSSLENLQKAKTADPNFNNWLGELKKLSQQQLSKVQEDLKSFRSQISQSGIDVQSDQSYLVANQAINDAINLIGKTTPTTAAGASATTPLKTGKEIRQDYRQQQRQERQGARQERRDTRKTEQDLKNLESTYQRLLPKMKPEVKLGYETEIAKLKKNLGK